MHINNETIRNRTENFDLFFTKLEDDSPYVMTHSAVTFSFFGRFDFSIKDLSSIMAQVSSKSRLVEGLLNEISFDAMQEKIDDCLNFDPFGHEQIPVELKTKRLKSFWDLVNRHFILPPLACYQYDPARNTCFDFGIMWNFCFILLNDRGQGIILHAGAAD